MSSGIESFATEPLQTTLPAYAYQEYADDPYFQAFVSAYNQISQGYLDWANQNPIPIYTDSNISGTMLDFVGVNLYGIYRPVTGQSSTSSLSAMNTFPMNTQAMDSQTLSTTGVASTVTDDLYKRTLTWILYRGDGKNFSLQWLRRRIARFLYGANGLDLSDIGLISTVHISIANSSIQIIVPYTPFAQDFIDIFSNGWLPVPFNLSFTAIQSLVAKGQSTAYGTAVLTL